MQSVDLQDLAAFGAIEEITGQRVANGGHVHPDLMGTAGFQPEAQQGIGAPFDQGLIMGHSPGTSGVHPAGQLAGHIQDRGVYDALPGAYGTADQGQIFPVESAGMQHLPQQAVGMGVLGHHQQAGGIPVQPVDCPETKGVPRCSIT